MEKALQFYTLTFLYLDTRVKMYTNVQYLCSFKFPNSKYRINVGGAHHYSPAVYSPNIKGIHLKYLFRATLPAPPLSNVNVQSFSSLSIPLKVL
jgi:hypothetical protein